MLVDSRDSHGVAAANEGEPTARWYSQGRGRNGAVRVALQRFERGLFVTREENPSTGPRTLVVLSFDDLSGFERWCADDPIRFDQPVLHQQVRRHGEELWRAHS